MQQELEAQWLREKQTHIENTPLVGQKEMKRNNVMCESFGTVETQRGSYGRVNQAGIKKQS
jgi:hypothetical protein